MWRRSIIEALDVIELLDARITPLDHELRPPARADARVVLLDTIPGVGDLLGLTLASEIGDNARFSSRAQADRLRRPGPEDQPVRRPLAHRRRSRPSATLQARRRAPARSCLAKHPLLSGRPTARHAIEKPRQLPRTLRANPSTKREMSPPHTPGAPDPEESRSTTERDQRESPSEPAVAFECVGSVGTATDGRPCVRVSPGVVDGGGAGLRCSVDLDREFALGVGAGERRERFGCLCEVVGRVHGDA